MPLNPALTVLIADDNALMRGMLALILMEIGAAEILNAANGIDVVEIYRNRRPDVVFLDIQMPVKDGLAALKEIKQINADAHVIMVSSFGSAANVKTAIDAGANGFVVKPYNMNRILGVMKRYRAAVG
ncbi:MAG: hypothetical protein A3G81_27750 [Betaproteobacteria bacterium RIFCSPLOWO2_12_FULL_65_14]|nr:MAG: hypothetical protein A3G81_27750 [Betaproteobacteria bacterium RIFCSPLOWO2_12_FULL_65_14]